MGARCTAILVAVLVVGASPAATAQPDELADDAPEKILLLPLSAKPGVGNKAFLAKADAALKEAARDVVGDALVLEKRARSARCVTSASCIGKLAKRAGAARAAAFFLEGETEGTLELRYLVATDAGDELLAGTRTFPTAEVPEALKRLVAELMVPASLSGVLRVPGVDEDAYLLIDGVPTSAAHVAEGIRVSLGVHRVTVLRPERDPEVHEVEVRLGEDAVVEVAPPPPAEERPVVVQVPLWPTFVAGGLTAAATFVGLSFGLDYAFSTLYANGAALNDLNEAVDNSQLPGYPATAARQPALAAARRSARTDLGVMSTAFLVATTAAAATVGLAVAWYLGRPEEEGP